MKCDKINYNKRKQKLTQWDWTKETERRELRRGHKAQAHSFACSGSP